MNLKKSVMVSNALHDKQMNELAHHLGITRVWLWHNIKENTEKYVDKMAEFYGISVFEFINRGK